ncbi:MAG: hypothetical protein WDM81_19215 [Rhizomicrobium sp.]
MFGALWVGDVRVTLTDGRVLSATSIVDGMTKSIALVFNGNVNQYAGVAYGRLDRLDATAVWRILWWSYLYNDVMNTAPLTGLGFGQSLAFPNMPIRVKEDARSPHNVNMTVLSRMGLIGLVLWIGMLGVWLQAMISAHLEAVRRGHYVWASILVGFACYVLALYLNGSFDLYIEAPTGGITFWSLIGAGSAMRRWYMEAPDYWEKTAPLIRQPN